MIANVTAQSQTYRLHHQASQADIRHGQTVRADVPHVRVTAMMAEDSWFWQRHAVTAERATIFFCNMGLLRVREVLEPGDREPLPTHVVVDGLAVPDSGTYDLVNVLMQSNGDLRLVIDDQTQVVRVHEPAVASSAL